MDAAKTPSQDDAEVLALLLEASKQYEAYLRLSAVGQTAAEMAPQQRAPYADWAHPIGLVVSPC